MNEQFHQLVIDRVDVEASDTLCVSFVVPEQLQTLFDFKQGQYLTFEAEIDQKPVRRSYSICSAAGEQLRVGIKKIPNGVFSNYAHAQFKPGAHVSVMPPGGQFYVDLMPEQARRYLFIAAGSGITPVISNIETILNVEPDSFVTLLYSNKSSGSMIFRDRLSWLKSAHLHRFQWINLFTQERQSADILNGRITNRKGAELNQRLINIASYDEFFLCGPESMISEVSRGLRAEGVAEAHVHYELFFASAEDARVVLEKHQARAKKYGEASQRVAVRRGGREVVFDLSADGENILDAAMAQGLDLPFSCKGGVCATCKAKVLEGEVDIDLNHALTPAQLAQGYVLTCQAHPVSANVVVDFDVS